MITTEAHISLERKVSNNLFLLSVDIEKYRQWVPGMFMQVSLEKKGASEPWLDSRAFSFASWGSSKVRILVRREGTFTSTLIEKALNGFITSVRYPFGNFLLNSGSKKIFLAGGAGISVFLSYLDYLNLEDTVKESVIILHSTKNEDETIRKIYWEKIPNNVHLMQFITNSKDRRYTGRFSMNTVESLISEWHDWSFYICGPPSFNAFWYESLKAIGVIANLEQWINEVISQ
jgi:NAD(P)H-flavin reductase